MISSFTTAEHRAIAAYATAHSLIPGLSDTSNRMVYFRPRAGGPEVKVLLSHIIAEIASKKAKDKQA